MDAPIWDIVDPVELTFFARAALEDRPENQFSYGAWFPFTEVAGLEYKLTSGQSDREWSGAARLRVFDGEPRMIGRAGTSARRGQMPGLGERMMLSELDQLLLNGPAGNDPVIQAIYNDAALLARRARNKMDLMAAQAVVDAAYDIEEGGINIEVDFGRKASHEVTAGTLWSDSASATPLSDLLSWVETYVDTNGFEPGAIAMRTSTRNLLLQCEEVRNAAPDVRAPARSTAGQLNAALQDRELPPIITVDRKIDAATPFLPTSVALMLPPAGEQMGRELWGQTLEAQELDIEQSEAPGLVVVAQKTQVTPIQAFTTSVGIGMPVLDNPDYTFRATVAA